MIDPLNPFADPFAPLRPRRSDQVPLTPQEEESLLAKIGGKALGGLAYAGSLLDKYTGSRAFRGLLGGRPEELLSILPGSDVLGITDERNRVSGRDLADQWGLTRPGDDSWQSTLTGLATDVLASPITYLSFGGGALTEAGQLAQKVGALPGSTLGRIKGFASAGEVPFAAQQNLTALGRDVGEIVGQPLGGVAGVGLPFARPSAILGTGAGGEVFLRGLGAVGNAIGHGRYSPIRPLWEPLQQNVLEPLGRLGRALFDKDVNSALSRVGQAAGVEYSTGVRQGLERARGVFGEEIVRAHEAGILDRPDLIRQVGETAGRTHAVLGPEEQVAGQVATNIRSYLDDLDDAGAQLGFTPNKLQDEAIDYLPRHQAFLDRMSKGYRNQGPSLPTNMAALDAREEILKNIPGGTTTLNRLTADPELSGILGRYGPAGPVPGGTAPTTALQREALVRERGFGWTAAEEGQASQLLARKGQMEKVAAAEERYGRLLAESQRRPLTFEESAFVNDYQAWQVVSPQDLADLQAFKAGSLFAPGEQALMRQLEQSRGLARWLEQLDPGYADAGVGFFSNHVIDDAVRTATAKIKRNEAGSAIQRMFAESATDASGAMPGSVRLDEALRKAGFDDINVAAQATLGRSGKSFNNSSEVYVPKDVVDDATRFMQGFQTPDVLRPVLGAVDQFTNLFKTSVTSIFPAFHLRNLYSGQWQNFVLGASDPRYSGVRAYLQPMVDAQKVIRGGTVEGAAEIPLFRGAGLTDEQATREIAKLAYQYRAASQGSHMELLGAAEQAAALQNRIPGLNPYPGFLENLKQAVPTSLREANPLSVAGVGGHTKDVFAPAAAGRAFGEAVEDTNRLGAFIAQLRQGYAPEVAAMRVRAAHVDYSALSEFERNVMRRLIPFYSFTRHIVPFTIQEMMKRPGGLGGASAMLAYDVRQGEERFIPEYLGGGLAVPLGEEKEGTQRFLTQIDTPAESTFTLLKPTWAGTAMGLLGMANPLVKMPLELATGKQFMSGRELADLYPMTGNTLADEAIMNSPVARLATTARTLADPRKYEDPLGIPLNLLSGVRVSDVDLAKQRDILSKQIIADTLRGRPAVGRYETLFVRPDQAAQLTPEDLAMIRLNRAIEKRAKEQAEQRRIGLAR